MAAATARAAASKTIRGTGWPSPCCYRGGVRAALYDPEPRVRAQVPPQERVVGDVRGPRTSARRSRRSRPSPRRPAGRRAREAAEQLRPRGGEAGVLAVPVGRVRGERLQQREMRAHAVGDVDRRLAGPASRRGRAARRSACASSRPRISRVDRLVALGCGTWRTSPKRAVGCTPPPMKVAPASRSCCAELEQVGDRALGAPAHARGRSRAATRRRPGTPARAAAGAAGSRCCASASECASTSSSSSSMPIGKPGRWPKRVLHVSVYGPQPMDVQSMSAKETSIAELRTHALIIGEVTLTSGATAQYYVDAKRAILRPAGFARARRAGRRATRASGRRPRSAASRWAPTRPPAPRSPAAPT